MLARSLDASYTLALVMNDPKDGRSTPESRTSRFRRWTRIARDRGAIARHGAEGIIQDQSSRRSWVRIALDALDRDRRHAGALLAGGLAFRFFVWSLPFSLVFVTLFGFLADRLAESPGALAQDSGMAAAIAGMVSAAVGDSSNGRLVLLVFGLGALAWASRSAIRALWIVHSVAWDLRRGMPTRASLTGAAAFTGVTVTVLAAHVIVGPLYRGGLVSDTLVTAALIGGLSGLALWVFRQLPNAATSPLRLLPGAVAFGVGAEMLRLVTAVYLADKLERVDDLYGALGLATVILLWLFLVGRLVVLAAMLNASITLGTSGPKAPS